MLAFHCFGRAFRGHVLARMESKVTGMQAAKFSYKEVLLAFFSQMLLVNTQPQRNIFSMLCAYLVVLLCSQEPMSTDVMFEISTTSQSFNWRILTAPREHVV